MGMDAERDKLMLMRKRILGTEGNQYFVADTTHIERDVRRRLEGHEARQ